GVDVVGQILPGAGHPWHNGLPAEFAFRADFARHAGHFGGEGTELLHHGVDRLFELKDFATNVDGDLARQIAVSDRDGDFGYVADLSGQVARHLVDAFREFSPHAADPFDLGLPAEFAFRAHFARHACHLGGENAQLLDHLIDDSC